MLSFVQSTLPKKRPRIFSGICVKPFKEKWLIGAGAKSPRPETFKFFKVNFTSESGLIQGERVESSLIELSSCNMKVVSSTHWKVRLISGLFLIRNARISAVST